MKTTMRLTVFAYDSPSDRRRARMAAALEAVGERVQRSVFEAWLSPDQCRAVCAQLEAIVHETDQLRVYTLCEGCRGRTVARGAPVAEPPPVAWIV